MLPSPEELYLSKLQDGQLQRMIDQHVEESVENFRIANIRAHYDRQWIKDRLADLESVIMKLDSSSRSDVLNPPILCFTDRALKDTLFKLDVMSGALDKLSHADFDFFDNRTVQVGQAVVSFSQEPLKAYKYANIASLS